MRCTRKHSKAFLHHVIGNFHLCHPPGNTLRSDVLLVNEPTPPPPPPIPPLTTPLLSNIGRVRVTAPSPCECSQQLSYFLYSRFHVELWWAPVAASGGALFLIKGEAPGPHSLRNGRGRKARLISSLKSTGRRSSAGCAGAHREACVDLAGPSRPALLPLRGQLESGRSDSSWPRHLPGPGPAAGLPASRRRRHGRIARRRERPNRAESRCAASIPNQIRENTLHAAR